MKQYAVTLFGIQAVHGIPGSQTDTNPFWYDYALSYTPLWTILEKFPPSSIVCSSTSLLTSRSGIRIIPGNMVY